MEDSIVLSYGDSLLKKSDINLLQNGQWLNDKIISFMFEFFQTEQYKENCMIGFIDPDVVQLIKLLPKEEVKFILSPLNLDAKQLIFIPLNDNASVTAGGSHWSLLVWDKLENRFEHYDSIQFSGSAHTATSVSKTLGPHLTKEKFSVSSIDNTPKQRNQSDCGVYVIKLAETICDYKLKNNFKGPVEFPDDMSDDIELNSRQEIKSLIIKLSKERSISH